MLIEAALIRTDQFLVRMPNLLEALEDQSLELDTYTGLLLLDLELNLTEFECVKLLADKGNVLLGRQIISQHPFTVSEEQELNSYFAKIRDFTAARMLQVTNLLLSVLDELKPNVKNECLLLQSAWEKAFDQDRFHHVQRDLLLAEELLKGNGSRQLVAEENVVELRETQTRGKEPVLIPVSDTEEHISPPLSVHPPAVDRLEKAIQRWHEVMQPFSLALKTPLYPREQRETDLTFIEVRQQLKGVALQNRERDWQQAAELSLRNYFYLPTLLRNELSLSFQQALALYGLKVLEGFLTQKDFDSAAAIYTDVNILLAQQVRFKPNDLSNFHRCGIRSFAALSANVYLEPQTFSKALAKEVHSHSKNLEGISKTKLIDYGRVIFFYYKIQALKDKQANSELFRFYLENYIQISELTSGDIELNSLFEASRSNFDEVRVRMAEEDDISKNIITENIQFNETLMKLKELGPYQIAKALRAIEEKVVDYNVEGNLNLKYMYAVLLMLFEMQKPEELVFTKKKIIELIHSLQQGVVAESSTVITLGVRDEYLHTGVLTSLEVLVKETIIAVSLTDLTLVRQHLANALESIKDQRQYLHSSGIVTRHLWHMFGDRWTSILVTRQKAILRQSSLKLSLQSEEILADEDSTLVVYIENTGIGAAQQVDITLASSDIIIQESRIVTFPIIGSGDNKMAKFVVRPRTRSRTNDIRLLVRYLDSQDNFVITSEDRKLFAKSIATHKIPDKSPYVWGLPLEAKTNVFFGREDVFNFLRTRFWGEERNKIIALQGERRMGKTSVIRQLEHRKIFGTYRIVRVDFQARHVSIEGVQEFLFTFARRIRSEAKLPDTLQVERSMFLQGFGDEYSVFENWLDNVEIELERRDTQIVIVFDEFEVLLSRRFDDQKQRSQRVAEDLLQYLRSLMQTRKRLNWIITGSWSLVIKQREYFSSLFGMALSYWLSYLKTNEAIALIQTPVQEYLTYDQDAIDRILRLTGGQPYHIQIMCDELFNRASIEHNHRIALHDVNGVIGHTLTQVTENNFRMVWSSLTTKMARKVLSATAEAVKDPNGYIKIEDVYNYLKRKGPGQSEDEFYKVLDPEDGELIQRELIVRHPVEATRIQIRSELLYRWLQKSKTVDTVLREER